MTTATYRREDLLKAYSAREIRVHHHHGREHHGRQAGWHEPGAAAESLHLTPQTGSRELVLKVAQGSPWSRTDVNKHLFKIC